MAATEFMRRALDLAAGANHSTIPNPMVGAVVVRDGRVVAEARHDFAGGPHAEALALAAAAEAARGATLYVTLEPCAHRGRTGPCAELVLASGVTRVVVALEDPDPRVSGRGLEMLRAAGIAVEVGDGAEEAELLNQPWLRARRSRRPFVALKFAMSLDGKIATTTRRSRWITGEPARAEAHRLRAAFDAVAVGAQTVIEDDPELTARAGDATPEPRQPLRVVVDGRLRISPSARLLRTGLPGRALVVTSTAARAERGHDFDALGSSVKDFEGGPRLDLRVVLEFLFSQGIHSLLIEGGGELAWSVVEAGLVDHCYAFVAPRVLGGRDSPGPVSGAGFAELTEALRLRFVGSRPQGEDVLLEAVPHGVTL